jgi:CxxC motif-containing protein (DUF1111 family)
MTRAVLLLPFLALAGLARPPAPTADDEPTEAPASFQMVTNGLTSQADFLANLDNFNEDATPEPGDEQGLGPTYNGTSCRQCHLNPTPGGGLSRFEMRAGRLDPLTGAFVTPRGGTLVRQLATDPAAQQRVPEGFFVTKRRSTSLFGLGYVEFIRDADLLANVAAQDPAVRGTLVVQVVTLTPPPPPGKARLVRDDNVGRPRPAADVPPQRIGRFGWKCQHGSLLDFAADAEINEKGVTSPIQPTEALAVNGDRLDEFDRVADPEDAGTTEFPFGHDVTAYTRFTRSLQAPPRNRAIKDTPDARDGEATFKTIGCAACHTPTWTTAPVGSFPAGSQATPAALGNKIIHPYSDFALHDISSGDTEVVQNGPPETRKMLRTAPLWGVRLVPEMGHDGRWPTFEDAIQGHGGQADGSRRLYNTLPAESKRKLKVFLASL